MIKEYKIPTPFGSVHEIYEDINWMSSLPNFVGFMEAPTDAGFETRMVRVDQPYRENVAKIAETSNKFAPYCAYIVVGVAHKTRESAEYMLFRHGSR